MRRSLLWLILLLSMLCLLCACKEEHTCDFGAWTVEEPATCGAWGRKAQCCACGQRQESAIPPTERHPLLLKNGNCSACGVALQATEGLQYAINEDGRSVRITGVEGDAHKAVILPAYYEQLPVTTVGSKAFEGHGEMESVTLPETLTTLESASFVFCTGLTEIQLPAGLTAIGGSAFGFCSGLKEITVPDGVTEIGETAFAGCSSLTRVQLPQGLIALRSGAFNLCTSLVEINLPDSLCIMEGSLFTGSKLTRVRIPEGVAGLGPYAFRLCGELREVTLPSTLTQIGHHAFADCEGLASVTFPSGVTTIGEYAFFNTGLTEVRIPANVTGIGFAAFSSCSALERIAVATENVRYRSIGDCLVDWESKTLILGCKNSVIPEGGAVLRIGEASFRNCVGLTSIAIPAAVTHIEESAFCGCERLTHVSLAEESKLKAIEIYAFSLCNLLLWSGDAGIWQVDTEEGVVGMTLNAVTMEAHSHCRWYRE